MKKVLRFRLVTSAVFLLCLVPIAATAQTFTTLLDFDGADGKNPYNMTLVQGLDGNLYGTTYEGGTYNGGEVFKVSPDGTLTTLYSFCSQPSCADGYLPIAGLVLATDGNFYGTTVNGGTQHGTAFKISQEGTLSTLYTFCTLANCADGAYPWAGLVQGTDGNFYGTTLGSADLSSCSPSCGTVFKLTSAGTLSTLYTFCTLANCADGAYPYAGLIQATDGDFYGTTFTGGVNDAGTIFEINEQGKLTTLYSFCTKKNCTDGGGPFAGLVQGTNGNFYGTTGFGGMSDGGTVFRLTDQGTFSTLHRFSSDGYQPEAGLVEGTDGNFYGTSVNTSGTIFKITPVGTFTTLHSFDGADGYDPLGGLVEHTSGGFYGTTVSGDGSAYDGTVFSLFVGLGPFVEAVPRVGKAGSKVIVLGSNLTGTTGVTFNGTAAAFTVVLPTEIETTIPSGATTGRIQVATPHGTLTSNVAFRVK